MKKANYKNIPTWYKDEEWINEENKKGVLYYLSDKLTDEEVEELLRKYNNVKFYHITPVYAPELKSLCIFIVE